MIKIFSEKTQDFKVKSVVCKKLKISEENVTYAAYEKFLFSYLFAIAIKENKVYLFGENEDGKKSKKPFEIPLKNVSYAYIDKKTDLNILLNNGKSINLTSLVGITKKSASILNELNNSLK